MKNESDPFKAFDGNKVNLKLGFWSSILLIIILVVGFLFIPLPHKITVDGIVDTVVPAFPIDLKVDGQLLFLDTTAEVQKGQTLFVIEEEVKVSNLKKALACIDSIRNGNEVDVDLISELGDFQYDWNAFVANYESKKLDKSTFVYLQKTSKSRLKISDLKAEGDELQDLLDLSKQELELVSNRYNENEKLFEKGGVSKQELDNWKKEVLNVEQKISDLEMQIIRNDSEEGLLSKEISSDEQALKLNKGLTLISFENQLNDLYTKLEVELNYRVFKSPFLGKIRWFNNIVSGAYLKKGSAIGALYRGNLDYHVKFKIPAKDKYKIRSGDKVKIYLEDFPKQKYGYLKSSVDNTDIQNERGSYLFSASIDSLNSNKGKMISILPDMRAVVKVETKAESIFYRIYSKMDL
jgi:multidrug resistance efflux pump